MKKLFYLISLLALASCSEGVAPDTYVPMAPYTLSVDKTQVESDGHQTATFIITDAKGKVLTDNEELMSKIYFKNEETGKRLTKRSKTFRSVEDGDYTFSATVSGLECQNAVTITSSGRSKYEVFRKNVALYRFTATWCQNCPSMTQGLERVSDWTKSRIVELGLHGAGSTYALSDGNRYVADYLIGRFGAPGFPSCVYDLDLMSQTRVYSDIEDIVFDRIADTPATCGIKASSAYADGELTISAGILSSTGGKYDLGFALLRDNMVPGGNAYEEEYDNVVVSMTPNYEVMSQGAEQLQKDVPSQNYSLELPVDIPQEDMADYSIVLFALRDNDGDVDIDNIVRFPVGESVEYVYN